MLNKVVRPGLEAPGNKNDAKANAQMRRERRFENRFMQGDSELVDRPRSIRSATTGELGYMHQNRIRFYPEEVDRVVKYESERYMDTYVKDKFPYIAAASEGKYLYLVPIEGKRKGEVLKVYDAFCFYGVRAATAHAMEDIKDAVDAQILRGSLCSANVFNASRSALCQYLFHEEWGLFTELLPNYKIYMLNSGSESNDAALKLACEYHREVTHKLDKKNTVISMHNGFHGRTGYALNLIEGDFARQGFPRIDKEVLFVKFGDSKELGRVFEEREGRILSVHFEPIQGEPGVNIAPEGFLKKMRELCDKEDAVMIADEVQTFARTGDWFASIALGATPDIIVTGKITSGGISPATVIYAKGEIMFYAHKHGNTYTGNPLACELVMTTMHIIERDGLLENSKNVGNYLVEALRERIGNGGMVKDVRGRGTMGGVELADKVKDRGFEYAKKAIEDETQGVMVTVAGGSGGVNEVLRLLLPMAITKRDADMIADNLARTLSS
ncbi:MAG: aspartate aminotransferase family protein [Candidatus Burarchaeum sp.]|nr:aspartate aminotransferase family protein [Candidatus Burarchaeum sp.]MDO8340017.1 aspartate aminotransferase family protein [Candidatus Burarchaeum sp.]